MTSIKTSVMNKLGRKNAASDLRDRLSEQVIAEAIRNTRRRYALYYLYRQNQPVPFADLVDQVAAWENCTTPDEVTTDQRNSVYAALKQLHLPYLEERNLVTIDHEHDRLESRLRDVGVKLSLAKDPRTSVPWYRGYLVVSAVASLAIGLTWTDLLPVGNVSLSTITASVVLVYTALSVIYWYDIFRWNRSMEQMPPDFFVSVEQLATDERWDGVDYDDS